MQVELEGVERLHFADGSPVRAASAVAPLGEGFLVVQDDATHGAWFRGDSATAVRLFPPVEGHDVFDEASGTKHLKPDLEAAVTAAVDGGPAVLMLGSGSSPARMRWALLRLEGGATQVEVAEMAPVYTAVAAALSVPADFLNLEGACVVGDVLRWFHRGLPSAGLPSGSVDLELTGAMAAVRGRSAPSAVVVTNPRSYDLGDVGGVGLAVTDAVVLPGGVILASAAAEATDNPRDDGPVVGSALVRLDGPQVVDVALLPPVEGRIAKVEGLMLLDAYDAYDAYDAATRVLAVVDVDDPEAPSLGMRLAVRS